LSAKNLDLLFAEDAAGWRARAVRNSREHKLQGDGRGDESDYGKLFESFATLDHTFLNPQPLALEDTKQLLNVPAQTIPANHRKRLRHGLDRVRAQHLHIIA
jgi:hypothetical protein